ncbi:MAG TPA: MFS transporter [Candidatus Stackebrandtia faecavium]|nr:MFS transporter [Candidatus Stackebrandtia faecavium]
MVKASFGRLWSMVQPPAGAPAALGAQMFVSSIGSGVFAAGSAIFFTQYVGLNVTEVALGLSIAGIASFVSQVPMGLLVDKWGSRTAWLVALSAQVLVFAVYPLAASFEHFVGIVVAAAMSSSLGGVARGRYIGDIVPTEFRVKVSAYMRAVLNGGYSCGVMLAGLALLIDTDAAYLSLPLANALSFAVDIVLVAMFCPRPIRSSTRNRTKRFAALRDMPFLTLVAINAVIMVSDVILTVVLPLWIIQQTDAPKVMVAVVFFANTSLSVLFQVRVSKGADGLAGAARAQRKAGMVLAASCVMFAFTGFSTGIGTVLLLILGAVLLTFGELFEAVGSWGISYGLAPADKRGEYLATYGLGPEFVKMVGPSAIVAIVLSGNPLGWLSIGVMFIVGGALAVPAAAWAHRAKAEPTLDSQTAAQT